MAETLSMEDRLKMTMSSSSSSASKSKIEKIVAGSKGQDDRSKSTNSTSSSNNDSSVAVLLVQGLHSGDKHILDQILEKNEDPLICSTVKQLPVQSLPQLLKELSIRFRTKTDLRPYIKWLRYALVHNASYLSSNPDIIEQLCSYYQEFESRVSLMDSMLKLQGKINFLMDQYDKTSGKSGDINADDQQALAVYEDASSSDTESEVEREESGESENEQDWDDLDWNDEDENDQTKVLDDEEDEEFLKITGGSKKQKEEEEDDQSSSSDQNEASSNENEEQDEEDDTADEEEYGDGENSMELG